MKIGIKLKEARLKKELTQENTANILNVSRSTISSWEVGRSYPDLESVVALSDLYNISLDELLREDSDMIKKLSLDSKLKSRLKFLIVSIIVISIIGGFYISMYLSSSNGNTEIDLSKIKITNARIKNIKSNDADTKLVFDVKTDSFFYGIKKDDTLIYVEDDGSINIVINTVFDPLSLGSKRKVTTSNSFMLPSDFSEDTKLKLSCEVRSGLEKVIGFVKDFIN